MPSSVTRVLYLTCRMSTSSFPSMPMATPLGSPPHKHGILKSSLRLSPFSLPRTLNSLTPIIPWVNSISKSLLATTSTLLSRRLPSINVSRINCTNPWPQIWLLALNVSHPCCSRWQHRTDPVHMAHTVTLNPVDSTALLKVLCIIHFSPLTMQPAKPGHHHLSLGLWAHHPNRSHCDPCPPESTFCSSSTFLM